MARGSEQEHRGPQAGEAFGVAGLTQKLHGISFPISKQELIDRFGNERFQWSKNGETMNLRDCLHGLPNEIQSVTQITQAVSDTVKQGTRR
jgi:hypothetical protein